MILKKLIKTFIGNTIKMSDVSTRIKKIVKI